MDLSQDRDAPIELMDAVYGILYTVDHPPRTIIRYEEQLSIEELKSCIQLLHLERKIYYNGREVVMTMGKETFLVQGVLHWNTAYQANFDIPVRPRHFPDTDVLLGALIRDNPPTKENPEARQPLWRQQGGFLEHHHQGLQR
ncbi:hypothetical protein ACHAP8_001966 [Fusarium lateritium]